MENRSLTCTDNVIPIITYCEIHREKEQTESREGYQYGKKAIVDADASEGTGFSGTRPLYYTN